MLRKVKCWALLCLKLIAGISRGLYWHFKSQLNDIVECLFLRILQASMSFMFGFSVILLTEILCFCIWRTLWYSCLLELGKLKENVFLLSCLMSSSLFSSCSQLSCSSCSPILMGVTGWKTDPQN